MTFEPRCLATGIGSLPHDGAAAMALVSRTIPQIPYMPQLPALGWHEGMMVQYTEGLPGLILDEQRQKSQLDTEQGMLELEAFYERVIADDPAPFSISEDHCHGLGGLLTLLDGGPEPAAVKTQVTGPVTQGLSTVDHEKRAIFYDETFQEVVVKNCAMKARWLLGQLEGTAPVRICFLDEPILSAFGSSVYVSIQREVVVAQLAEVAGAVREAGGLCGVHCCGNTDWSLLTEAGVDIISFDAFEFAFSLPLYPEALEAFIRRGGIIAWGIVPTSAEALAQATVESLAHKLDQAMAGLTDLGLSRQTLLRQALLTPACGLGSTSMETAERAFELLHELSEQEVLKGPNGH